MSKTIFSAPHFTDEAAAYAFVEAHLWPEGPVCPHCQTVGRAGKLQGRSNRPGLWKCYACREPFSVKIGTIFEKSHIQMRDWLAAIHLICSSKKGISANQLSRTLGITLKSAWFLGHRIREAMAPGVDVIGGPDMIVEADETELSLSQKTWKTKRPRRENKKILSLVERGGRVRSRVITGSDKPISVDIHNALFNDMHRASILHTDGAQHYKFTGAAVAHESVDHNKQFARTAEDGSRVHTNSAEGYFSIFKRGLVGTYQHMSEQHLHRYLAEFDFRMSNRARLGVNDTMRAEKALKGVVGKRLTYRTPSHQGHLSGGNDGHSMSAGDEQEFARKQMETLGASQVRTLIESGQWPSHLSQMALAWLTREEAEERSRSDASQASQMRTALSARNAAWIAAIAAIIAAIAAIISIAVALIK